MTALENFGTTIYYFSSKNLFHSLYINNIIIFQVGNDCMVDESVSIGEKVSIKKSIIGKHTTIGEKVKISNSVIMDHVTIMEG